MGCWISVKQLSEDTQVSYSTKYECELRQGGTCVDVTGIPLSDVTVLDQDGVKRAVQDPVKKAAREARDAQTAAELDALVQKRNAAKQSLKDFDLSKIKDKDTKDLLSVLKDLLEG